MEIRENVSLKPFNTFGIDAKARYFASIRDTADFHKIPVSGLIRPIFVTGGGSNLLFAGDYPGTVLRIENKGIRVERESAGEVFLRAGAGEVWDEFVRYCVQNQYYGVENLSLIPGSVGAGPVQNIGAYGVELKDVFYELTAYDLSNGQSRTFSHAECEFGYRDSIFKGRYKDRFIVMEVVVRLSKIPGFALSYGSISEELQKQGIREITLETVREVVCSIRRSKLPDPSITGNAGSFFKNPTVDAEKYLSLKTDFPGLIAHGSGPESYKLAAGWMIEQCGWKGRREGNAAVHERQALVLVNLGNAKGSEILSLANKVQQSVFEKFGVTLEREVQVV